MVESTGAEGTAFEQFFQVVGPRLRRALVLRYGMEAGTEAASDALSYAWEHWDRVGDMSNPAGYLWRVAQSAARRQRRIGRAVAVERRDDAVSSPEYDPLLEDALSRLKPDVRVAVVLVRGYGWTYQEVAELLGVPLSTVRNHVHRGLKRLATMIGESL